MTFAILGTGLLLVLAAATFGRTGVRVAARIILCTALTGAVLFAILLIREISY